MSKALYESTKIAFKALIGNCRYMQRHFLEQVHTTPSYLFLKEFCTVRISGARRSGHTCTCADLLSDENWFKYAIYLGHTGEAAKHAYGNTSMTNSAIVPFKDRFRSVQQNVLIRSHENECDGVFIDDTGAGKLDDEKIIENIYRSFEHQALQQLNNGKTFVFVFVQ